MSSFQELLQQKQKEADRQKQIREKQAKLEAERAEKEKAERVEREKQEEERARQLRAAARRKEQDDAEKARKAALLKEKIERDRAQQKPSLLTKSASRASSVSSKTKSTPVRIKSNASASSSTAGTKAPVLTREEKRKLKEDREFGVTAPNAAVKVKMTEGDRVARMLAAATAGRGLNAKIPERAHVRRPESERENVNGSSSSRGGPSASASLTANRTGPTYKAQSSVAHHTSSKPVKGVERLQEEAKVLASSNATKDRRSIDEIQRAIKATRNMDEDRGFFGQESARASTSNSERRTPSKSTSQRVPDRPVGSTSSASAGSSSRMKQRNTQSQHTEDTSYIINKMGLLSDERESQSRSRHDKNGSAKSKSTPTKRRRQPSHSSDESDEDRVDQDFDSDDLDDVDIRRKKKKAKSNGIGRTREVSPPPRQKKRPMGGSVLAAAGLDIYKMFGRKDREFYLSRDRASDSEDDMEADAATIRKEEARAARQAREDDRREEEAERKRAAEKKRRMERDKGR
ncbi:hypothetical protein QFC24_006003 [Naganishia onofrii]|uniref:Uncharacterized protein n=1 Tax=Naganishia onofrii TaxID=1851511 RepID=A0ACC2X5Y5_9TREE|nr:hypothetical protein QFC24_006003 [Naganishia onofrii]